MGIFPSSVLLILITLSPLYAQEVLDSICVIVDKEIILESELSLAVQSYFLEQGLRTLPDPQVYRDIRDRILRTFITQKILYTKALEDTVKVEERAVNREVDRRFKVLVQQAGSEKRLEEYFQRPIGLIKQELARVVREGMVVDLVRNQIAGKVTVTPQEVKEFFREFSQELPTIPERIELSHLLLKVEPSQEAIDAARDTIEMIRQLLSEGADFDSLAMLYSRDPSAAQGGRLGFTTRGDLLPELEEVAYKLDPGTISEVVRSRNGFHLIRLLERQGERISIQHILIPLIPSEEDKEKVFQIAEELRARIISGEDFGEVALRFSQDEESREKRGKLGWFNFNDLPESFQSALAGLTDGDISQPFQTEFGVHIIKVNRRIPAHKPDLENDYPLIEQYALNHKREEVINRWVKEHIDEHYIYPPLIWE